MRAALDPKTGHCLQVLAISCSNAAPGTKRTIFHELSLHLGGLMESAYEAAARAYRSLVKKLVEENIAMLGSMKRRRKTPSTFECLRDKVVIPFLETSPKSNFLSITPMNIFTKDDPVLRYVPSTKKTQPSLIAWFEDTVLGNGTLDEPDTIDIMFLRRCAGTRQEQEALDHLRTMRGSLDMPSITNMLDSKPGGEAALSMEGLFCPVCCIFDCGIHRNSDSKALNFNEPMQCICGARTKVSEPFAEDSIDIGEYNLSPCVSSLIVEMKLGKSIPCEKFPRCTLDRKRVTLSGRLMDSKQFFEPCSHMGECQKGVCGCVESNTYCEFLCSCVECSNVFFCCCARCDSECPCMEHNRECSDLCGCSLTPKTDCNNRPIQQRRSKKVSVCKSKKHGLGLFCEEFMHAGEFVIQYTGELISDKEAERRGNFYEMNGLSYLFNCVFSGQACLYSVDSFFLGNKSRFINHSVSEANLRSEILVSNGCAKIVFYSLRDIYKGEELLFDYQFTEEHKLKHGIAD